MNQLNTHAQSPLQKSQITRMASEFITSPSSHFVRHVCALGKEVMEDASTLFEIIRLWHATPVSKRPGTFGIITASAQGLETNLPEFVRHPLSWVVVSLDVPSVRLRSPENETPLLTAALKLRAVGGVEAVGVNTLLTPTNLDEVITLGRRLNGAEIHQWSLGSFLSPSPAGQLKPVMQLHDYRQAIESIAKEFRNSKLRILFDLDYTDFIPISGCQPEVLENLVAWRYEYPLTSNLTLTALNPHPGYFLRARWDGELLAKGDFKVIGLERGAYGKWQPGRGEGLLADLVSMHQ
ncbi:MAG: hypothetical protein K8R87_12060 [Verrucomicrobia bacterium]|nr:hypothetical protein [Verrucomicrobiota bacterium]